MFSFAILGINQGHNLKFEALIDVRPLTILEGGQVPTGGVNGESFGDDLLKNFSFAYFWLCWVFVAVWAFFIFREWGLLFSGAGASHCGGFSCHQAHEFRCTAQVAVAHRLSCSAACGIFPDQGLNRRPLHCKVGS